MFSKYDIRMNSAHFNAPARKLDHPGMHGNKHHFDILPKHDISSWQNRSQTKPNVQTQKHPAGKDPNTGFHPQIVDISRNYASYNNMYEIYTNGESYMLPYMCVNTRNMNREAADAYSAE